MRQLTIKDIRDLNPCYDPIRFLSEDWTGTVLDILNIKECEIADRLWVGLRLVDEDVIEKFVDGCGIRDYDYYTASTADAASTVAADAAYDKVRQKQLNVLINLLGDLK